MNINLNDIEVALKEDRIIPVYQAIRDNKTDQVNKYETLARIRLPDGKLISAYKFIEVALQEVKSSRVYFNITKTIINKSFNELNDKSCDFSINLSYFDISDNETKLFLIAKLKEFPLIGERLIIEITEGEGANEFWDLKIFMSEMRKYNCRFALDDFGTGYSNFINLIELKYDYIKIDGSIIKHIDENIQSHFIAEMMAKIASLLSSEVIAEYVHNEKILEMLSGLQIRYSQGFYIAEPLEYTKLFDI